MFTKKIINRGIFGSFYVLYSTLLHLPSLRCHCVGGCWDRNYRMLGSTKTDFYNKQEKLMMKIEPKAKLL
jgi:hypothetical protein